MSCLLGGLRNQTTQKHGMESTARKLGIAMIGKKIHCLFPEKHHGGSDRNPSCVLYEDHFHCFSCEAHGDAIDLVRRKLGCSFQEAIFFLGSSVSLDPSPNPVKQPKADVFPVFNRLLELCVLPSYENPAGAYLSSRCLNPDMCAEIGLRYLEDPLRAESVLRSEFDSAVLAHAGVFNSNGQLMFRNHPLLCPFEYEKRVGYLVGRSLEAFVRPKEIKPVGLSCPYPFLADFLGIANEVYVCEGVIDALSAIQLGFPAIGVPGANAFSDSWLQYIPKSCFLRVIFDSDSAGLQAAVRLRDRLRVLGFRCESLQVPEKDLNAFLKSFDRRLRS